MAFYLSAGDVEEFPKLSSDRRGTTILGVPVPVHLYRMRLGRYFGTVRIVAVSTVIWMAGGEWQGMAHRMFPPMARWCVVRPIRVGKEALFARMET